MKKMKKLLRKVRNLFENIARRVLKNEIEYRCNEMIRINHAVVGAHEELLKVLNNKKATKAQMTEAMEKAVAQLNEAYRRY